MTYSFAITDRSCKHEIRHSYRNGNRNRKQTSYAVEYRYCFQFKRWKQDMSGKDELETFFDQKNDEVPETCIPQASWQCCSFYSSSSFFSAVSLVGFPLSQSRILPLATGEQLLNLFWLITVWYTVREHRRVLCTHMLHALLRSRSTIYYIHPCSQSNRFAWKKCNESDAPWFA